MAAAATLDLTPEPTEQRMLLHGVSWKEYVILRELMDRPGLRMTYIEGALELMSPSSEHEQWKTNIARLVELYAFLTRVPLHGYGSTTFKKEAKERGAEPDECYLVDRELVDYPQIVLEVIHSSPLLNKLDVYAEMGVAEVWAFKDGAFAIYALDGETGRYAHAVRSTLIPGIDFALVARLAVRKDTPQALVELERAVRG